MKSRREFLKLAALSPVIASYPPLASAATPFAGKFVVTVQAVGAWMLPAFVTLKRISEAS